MPDRDAPIHEGIEKAYLNREFVESPQARPLRILAEYIEPRHRFDHYRIEDTIVFFGSARICSREQAQDRLAQAEAGEGDVDAARKGLELSGYYESARALAHRLTLWSKGLTEGTRRFVICSGGGPGIMEAANRGASEAKGLNVGLNITLPFETSDNPYITRELSLSFHYFFMRKFWFTYLAKAVVIFPGGFGTLDELFETLTLVQTGKIRKKMPVVLFGTQYWNDVVDLHAMARYGTIDDKDLNLVLMTDSVDQAFDHLTEQLSTYALAAPGATL